MSTQLFTTDIQRPNELPLLFRTDKSSRVVSRIDEATHWDACPYTQSNANTFVCALAYRVFQPRVSGLTSGAPLGAFGTLGVPPWLIPPHLVGKPYTNPPPSSIVTMFTSDFGSGQRPYNLQTRNSHQLMAIYPE